MPARDRTDAVDWSAVEAWLVGSQVIANLGERMGGDPAPAELSHALAAVRLVRAIGGGSIRVIGWDDAREWFGVFGDLPNGGEQEFYAPTPLAAFQRALDASKGEG